MNDKSISSINEVAFTCITDDSSKVEDLKELLRSESKNILNALSKRISHIYETLDIDIPACEESDNGWKLYLLDKNFLRNAIIYPHEDYLNKKKGEIISFIEDLKIPRENFFTNKSSKELCEMFSIRPHWLNMLISSMIASRDNKDLEITVLEDSLNPNLL